MEKTIEEFVILAVLEFIGLLCAFFGFFGQYNNVSTLLEFFYLSIWYILTFFSNVFGMSSVILEYYNHDLHDGEWMILSQLHYLFCWLTLIVGYPVMVCFAWISLFPRKIYLAHCHLILSAIPIGAWFSNNSEGVVRASQICVGIAAISHILLSYFGKDNWGFLAAVVMLLTLKAFAMPTQTSPVMWELNPRELFIIGLEVVSVLMYYSINYLENVEANVDIGIKGRQSRH